MFRSWFGVFRLVLHTGALDTCSYYTTGLPTFTATWYRFAVNMWSVKCRTGFVCPVAPSFSVMQKCQAFNIFVTLVMVYIITIITYIIMIYCLQSIWITCFICFTQIELHKVYKAHMGVYKYCGCGVRWGIAQMQVHETKTPTHWTHLFLESSSVEGVCSSIGCAH